MSRPRLLLIIGSVLCLGGAATLFAWHFWPEPPPSTVDEVYGAVMSTDPTQLPEKDLERWIENVAATVERLPPHEFEKLITKALQDEQLRGRFESLKPEQRRKMMGLLSQAQQSRMMAKMGSSMVKYLKAMPAPLRKVALKTMLAHRKSRGKGRRHHKMTRVRFAQRHAATTPRQRAEFVRAMREMRQMLEEAGIGD